MNNALLRLCKSFLEDTGMQNIKRKILLPALLIPHAFVHAMSEVWNFRIAQITGQPISDGSQAGKHGLVALLFDQYRKKYSGVYQNYIGFLGSYIAYSGAWSVRTDGAFSHIKERNLGVTTFEGTETDDILWTIRRGFEISDRSSMAYSMLFGVPTHKMLRLKHIDFGYSQIGLGMQWDGSYDFNYAHSNGALLYGARYIHFFERDVQNISGCTYRFTIGNIWDILSAYKHNWLQHGFEIGSTVRSCFGGQINPYLEDVVSKNNYQRADVYVVYKYKFAVNNVGNRLLYYISFARDLSPKTFGNRWIVTLWTSWNGRF
jgi:hypothetical protein